ncbi:hypothetical protein BC835DRAFT_1311744, partial [Cytidiella melzeri]
MPPDNSQYPDACLIRLGKFPTGLAGVGATAIHAAGPAALIGLYEHYNATKNGGDSPYSDSPDAVPQQGPQYQYNAEGYKGIEFTLGHTLFNTSIFNLDVPAQRRPPTRMTGTVFEPLAMDASATSLESLSESAFERMVFAYYCSGHAYREEVRHVLYITHCAHPALYRHALIDPVIVQPLADAAFVGCAAANTIGIPSALVTNFTFDSVYSYLSTVFVESCDFHQNQEELHPTPIGGQQLPPDIPIP